MYEKKWNISDHTGQQLGFMSSRCFCRYSYHFKLKMEFLFPLTCLMIENNTKHNLTIGFIKSFNCLV